MCLGAVIDKKISVEETLFLPENIMKYLNKFENKDKSKVIKKVIYFPEEKTSYLENLPPPLLTNFILSLIIILITLINYKNNSWTKSLDFLKYKN